MCTSEFVLFVQSNSNIFPKTCPENSGKFIEICVQNTCKLLVPQPSTVTVPPVTAAPARK